MEIEQKKELGFTGDRSIGRTRGFHREIELVELNRTVSKTQFR